MKRFFPTVQREASFKKPATGELVASFPSASTEDGTSLVNSPSLQASAPATSTSCAEEEDPHTQGPLRFMSWNANSFFLRIKNNLEELTSFLQRVDPDVIAIQEVRMPAAGRKGEPKNQGEMKDDTNPARDEKQIMMRALSRPPFGSYKVWWSLADTKYGGTALLVKQCFKPLCVKFSLDQTDAKKHEVDGRVILAEFEHFFLMNTYAPNNGWKDEELSFQRRRKWDQRVLNFASKASDKPLIWCGDLNVSHEEIDVSHPEFFKNAKLQGYVPPRKEDCGQPGFTQAERERFSKIMEEGRQRTREAPAVFASRNGPASHPCASAPDSSLSSLSLSHTQSHAAAGYGEILNFFYFLKLILSLSHSSPFSPLSLSLSLSQSYGELHNKLAPIFSLAK